MTQQFPLPRPARRCRHRAGTSVLSSVLLVSCLGLIPAPTSAQGGSADGPQIVTVQGSRSGSSMVVGGTVAAYKQVILSAQIPGRVEKIAGKEGDPFKQGDILVTIDDDDLQAKRRAAVAQYNTALAGVSNAQVQYDRELRSPQSRSITRSGGMGMPNMMDQMFTQPFSQMMPGTVGGDRYVDRGADLHSYGTQLNQAQSQLTAARSAIDEIDAKLRDAHSKAPFAGVISKKLVEEGDTVQPGQPLIEFADLKYLQIRADVPVRLVTALQKGMLIPARVDAGGKKSLKARVAQIFPIADEVAHTITVKFDLPIDVKVNPGTYAEVMIPDATTSAGDVPVIPDSAVVWRGSLPAVYVAGDGENVELRLVRLGDVAGPNEMFVISGLEIGERIYAVPPSGSSPTWRQRTE